MDFSHRPNIMPIKYELMSPIHHPYYLNYIVGYIFYVSFYFIRWKVNEMCPPLTVIPSHSWEHTEIGLIAGSPVVNACLTRIMLTLLFSVPVPSL